MIRTSKLLTSIFGIGLIPLAPGTWGSLAGMAMAYFLGFYTHSIVWVWASAIILFLVGWFLTKIELQYASIEKGKFDPSYVVIDEVAGMILAIAIVGSLISLSLYDLTWVFCLFRVFDILKPFPIDWVDQKLCKSETTAALGVMLDDILAGIFAATVFIVWYYVWITF